MTSNHEARFHATREPLGSYRIISLTGEWATGTEREVVLAQGAAEALFALMSKEREPLVDLRTDLLPIDWPNDEYGYTTEGYYRDGKFPSAPGC